MGSSSFSNYHLLAYFFISLPSLYLSLLNSFIHNYLHLSFSIFSIHLSSSISDILRIFLSVPLLSLIRFVSLPLSFIIYFFPPTLSLYLHFIISLSYSLPHSFFITLIPTSLSILTLSLSYSNSFSPPSSIEHLSIYRYYCSNFYTHTV